MKQLLILLLFFPAIVFAQDRFQHQKKMFTDEEGRVYVNKALPLYFKISTTANPSSDKHLLKSKSSPANSNPLYFDKEGLNYVYTPWAVDTITKKVIQPKQYVKYEIYVDGIPPTTKPKNNMTAYQKGDTLFFGTDLKIDLKASDKTSGVEKIYYSIDNSGFKEYSSPLTFGQEKAYIIKFYSVDNVGNVEKIQTIEFTIDNSKPLTNLEIQGVYFENIIPSGSAIALKPQDAFSGVAKTYYILDNNKQQVYTSPIQAKSLREGEHILSYFTEDAVKNQEKKNVFNFYVDKTAPIIIDELIGNSFFLNGKQYTSGRTKLQLSAIDNRAGVKAIYYSINNQEYQLYKEPFYLPNQQGNLQIKYYAVDNVENKTNSGSNNNNNNKFFESYTDLDGPKLAYEFKGENMNYNDTFYISPSCKIILKATDQESGVQKITYSIDQKIEQDFSGGITVADDGVHNLDFFGYDNVNNSNQQNISFIIDGTGPEIISQFSMNPYEKKKVDGKEYLVFPKHVILYISAFDKMVGAKKIFYSINNSSEILYTSFLHNFNTGEYELKIRAIDFLGNENFSLVYFIIQ